MTAPAGRQRGGAGGLSREGERVGLEKRIVDIAVEVNLYFAFSDGRNGDSGRTVS